MFSCFVEKLCTFEDFFLSVSFLSTSLFILFFAQQTSKCDVTQGRFSLAGSLNAPTIKKQTNAKKKKRGRFYAVADDDDRAVVVDNNIIEVLNFRLIIRTKTRKKR